MCGIIGYIGDRRAAPILMSGLKRLEYRGYDSAGIALVSSNALRVHKAAGKLTQLEAVLPKRLGGKLGIGHTRWATHGVPSDANAHPHVSADDTIAVVHNGIVENAATLRARLEAEGVEFASETDSEIIAHLIARTDEQPIEQRVRDALSLVRGTYGIAVIDASRPDCIVIARKGSPVIIGIGDREMFVASDVGALVRHTRQVVHLEDGEIAVVDAKGFQTMTMDARPISKSPATVEWEDDAYERDGHAHFMYKEILDQREAVVRTLVGRLNHQFHTAHLGGLNLDARELLDVKRVKLLGCGSAYYAGISGAHLVESLARIPASAEPAAEFRYRNPVIERDTLYVAVSQSGETIDTLMAVQEVRRCGGRVLGIVNVVGSSIAREADGGIYMHAGPEVAVASTKAYTCSLVALALLALQLGRTRDLSPEQGRRLIEAMERLPADIEAALATEPQVKAIALRYAHCTSAFFIGRGPGFPHRPRRRAEAQGDLVHPRRGLSGLGAQARADRACRPGHPDRCRAAARRAARQVDRVDRGGAGAERPGDRADPSRQRPHRRARGRDHRGAPHRGRAQPDRDGGSAPALRLSLRARARTRHRPAAQSGQERDGGVANMDPAVTHDMAVEARSVTKTFAGDGDDVTALDDALPP